LKATCSKNKDTAKSTARDIKTSQNYYELTDASEAHGSLQSLPTLRRWNHDEIKAIIEQWPLALDIPPTFREVKDFIRASGLETKQQRNFFKWQQLKKSI